MTAKRSKRIPTGAPATKWFITAMSLTALLGGWVSFTLNPGAGSDPVSQDLANSLQLNPIPTVVPAPSFQDQPTGSSSGTSLQPSQPALRSVTAPQPAPITVTRSSR